MALAHYFAQLMDGFEKGLEKVAAKLFSDLGALSNETLQKIEDLEKKLGPSKAVPEILKLIKEYQGKVVSELLSRGKDGKIR